MLQYQTEQKKLLASYLHDHKDRAFTVEEICEGIRGERGADAPGKSTLYRLITRMVEEGSVKRFVRENSRKFVYQAVECEHCDAHLHMKCTDCGKLFHMEEKVTGELLSVIRKSSFFCVSEEKTVLFGTCGACLGGKEKV